MGVRNRQYSNKNTEMQRESDNLTRYTKYIHERSEVLGCLPNI